MTMKTRSSVNHSNHIAAATVSTTTANRTTTAIVDQILPSSSSSSSISHNNNNTISATFDAPVNADAIMAANHEATQKFLKAYKAHLQKKFVAQAHLWLTAANFNRDQINEIIASFAFCRIDSEESIGHVDGCTVFSPVKKKQKSNDYTASSSGNSDSRVVGGGTSTSAMVTNKSQKMLLPPKVDIAPKVQHPIVKKYAHIQHGLSVAELLHIESLKKAELIAELEVLDGEYHKSWNKSLLVDTLLRTHASRYQPETAQTGIYPDSSPPTGKQSGVANQTIQINDEVMIIDAPIDMKGASVKQNVEYAKVDTAREKSADDNKDSQHGTMKNDQQKSDGMDYNECCSDDQMSLTSLLALHSEKVESNLPVVKKTHIIDQGAANSSTKAQTVIDSAQPQIEQAPSNDSEDAVYVSAVEQMTQSQSQNELQKSPTTLAMTTQNDKVSSSVAATKATYEPLSVLSSSSSQFNQQKQPPRKSPTTVPVGIVDSAKKLLMSGQKKQYHFNNQKLKEPIGRVLYPDAQSTSTVTNAALLAMATPGIAPPVPSAAEPEKTVMKLPSTIFPGDLTSSNRILSTPAYSSNGTTMGMSQKIQASKEARQAQVARMKEKSKQTLPQKGTNASSDKQVPYVSQKSVASNNSKMFRYQPENAVNLTLSTPSITAPPPNQYVHSAMTQTALVDTVKSKTQHQQTNIRGLTKAKSPVPIKSPEFTNYEMTDGEYDSDDEDDDEAFGESNKKQIPDWARSKKLEKALEIQFSKNYSIDPDELFGEVETCNLEAIFGKRSSKYRHRNSSGDWTKDRVTDEEKRWYKLQMAQWNK